MKRLTANFLAARGVLLLATVALAQAPANHAPPARLPGVVRQEGRNFLIENNSASYIVWHALNITNATLVHLDTHDDCRFVAPSKLQFLHELVAEREFDEIFHRSDIAFFLRFETPEDRMLFDLGNFIYPCIADGTVSNFYWVVPDKTMNDAAKDRLQTHLRSVLRVSTLEGIRDNGANGFSFNLKQTQVVVTTLDGMPQMPEGCLLDLDTDFFAFPHAMTDRHLKGDLIWDPERVCTILRQRAPRPAVVTVCASVCGGYLPLLFRFIPDACFDFFATGEYPKQANDLLLTAIALRKRETRDLPQIASMSGHFQTFVEYLTGCLRLDEGKMKEAIAHFRNAAAAQPVYNEAFLNAAEIALAMGEIVGALELIEEFERHAGVRTITSVRFRIESCLKTGDHEQAEILSEQLIKWTRDAESLMLYALALTNRGRIDEAVALYLEAIAKDPEKPILHYNLAVLLARQGKNDEAMTHYANALLLEPDLADAHNNLGVLFAERGDLIKAVEHYSKALLIRPDDAAAHNNLGFVLAIRGQTGKAIEHYTRALEIKPAYPEAHNNFGRALAVLGKLADAVAHYEAALRINPDFADAHANMGLALAEQGRLREAIIHYRRALVLKPGWSEMAAHMERAAVALKEAEKERE